MSTLAASVLQSRSNKKKKTEYKHVTPNTNPQEKWVGTKCTHWLCKELELDEHSFGLWASNSTIDNPKFVCKGKELSLTCDGLSNTIRTPGFTPKVIETLNSVALLIKDGHIHLNVLEELIIMGNQDKLDKENKQQLSVEAKLAAMEAKFGGALSSARTIIPTISIKKEDDDISTLTSALEKTAITTVKQEVPIVKTMAPSASRKNLGK